jgi:Spy/CpxP family protein refolding chaperone
MKFTHILLFATVSMFALPAFSQSYWAAADMDDSHEDFRPGGRKGKMGKGPLPHEFLRRHADQLGISEDVLEQVEAIVAEVKDSQRTLRRDIQKLKIDVRYEMDQDNPDRDKVMNLIREAGELKIKQHQARTGILLDIRALLTPTQREGLERIMRERRKAKRGGKRGRRP